MGKTFFVAVALSAAFAFGYETPKAPPENRHSRAVRRLDALDAAKVRAAWEDMAARWPARFERNPEWLRTLERRRDLAFSVLCADWGGERALCSDACCGRAETLLAEVRAHLLENPLLDFDRIVVVRRPDVGDQGLHANFSQPRDVFGGCSNEVGVLSRLRDAKPKFDALDVTGPHGYAGELCLDFDAAKLMYTRRTDRTNVPPEVAYTMASGRRVRNRAVENVDRVVELDLTKPGAKPVELPLIPDEDCNCYAGCYLPDGATLFLSDATMVGVPCVVGTSWVASIYRKERSGAIRRLTFDQDNSWHPVVMADGRVLFQHWEYTDIVHFASRRLYTMNPDGTRQRAYYGTGAFWPNSLFRARPCPDAPNRFTAIVSGHHGQRMTGELVLFDAERGDSGTNGVVRRFVQEGQVRPVIRDRLADFSWPKFAFPAPLSQDYVIVAARPNLFDGWGLYLADAFGNLTPIVEEKGWCWFEATPLVATPRPPILADETKRGEPAWVNVADVYAGGGLAGVPRGTVKSMRVFSYSFAYRETGAERDQHGLDGPWDPKRILGTVPVEPDGSCHFLAPANVPLALQPLDADGCAVQSMRSWFNAMPGEHVSCVGCHERRHDSPPSALSNSALRRAPDKIKPWRGPERGLDFRREVQPVLTRHCVECHRPGGRAKPDFTDRSDVCVVSDETYYLNDGKFPPAYLALCSYVRTGSREGDNRMPAPGETAADTTELMQTLDAGHHGVRLDAESRDRLVTWIDLGRMGHGAWSFCVATNRVAHYAKRRRELQKRYADVDEDHERDFGVAAISDAKPPRGPDVPKPSGEGKIISVGGEGAARKCVDLGGGVKMEFVRVPSGRFVDARGIERTIAKPFWIAAKETSNAELRRVFARHESGIEPNDFMKFSEVELGYDLDGDGQPAVRVSAETAEAFCRAVGKLAGGEGRLPSGAEWEWAARAGAESALAHGGLDDDFSKSANLADKTFRRQDKFSGNVPLMAVAPWRPADERFDDGFRVTAPCGSFAPNAWGLFDMNGNVWEWTADRDADGRAVARGGSFWTRPKKATFASSVSYPAWRRVHDVGFRVAIFGE